MTGAAASHWRVALITALAAAVLGCQSPGAPGASAGSELTTTEAYLANWPQFRGPGGNGIAPSRDPPVDWDGPSGRSFLWKAEVPRWGQSSPVVWGDRVFLTGADGATREIFCWDARTGDLLWRRLIDKVPGSPGEVPRVSEAAGYAASTMALDGRAAYAIFATGDIAAVDLDGALIWSRNLGLPKHVHGFSSSLALYDRSVIVQLDQETGGRVMALDTATGATLWETPRRVLSSYCSPVVVSMGTRTEIILNGNPILSSYDARTGRQLWQVQGMTGEIGPSPSFAEGRVIANDQMLKILAVDTRTGRVLWEYYDEITDTASPLAAGGLAVVAAGYGVVVCLEAASGKVVWKQTFDTGFTASPILAGGRIYAMDRSGVMRVLEAGRDARVLGSPAIGETVEATPAFVGRRIYIRGSEHLFCVGARGG